jgi:putative endonuclease
MSGSADALRHKTGMAFPQTIVYVLRSDAEPSRYYTGLTSNLASRLNAHNSGRVPHTANGRPWIVDVVVEFSDERRAVAFEKYLQSGSGNAFAKRHLR